MGNKRKGSHANCFVPKNYPSYLDSPKPTRKQTNYERIKAMSIDEMAEWIAEGKFFKQCKKPWLECIRTNCADCQKKWLEMEVEE